MQKHSDIKFLHNNEIDKQRWDECIDASPHGLIYARSFYLDIICPGWHALSGANYDWVLPVTHKKKWGIAYLYQPPFTQQSGVFAKKDAIVPYQQIIEWLQQHYKFWEVSWNYATDRSILNSSLQINSATNFILNLKNPYESILSNYSNVLIKNLKRSKGFQHSYKTTEDFNECIDLYRKHYSHRIPHVTPGDYKNFSNICLYALKHKMLVCRQALDNKGECFAAAVLLTDGKRLYNIINVITEAGRKRQANHFLLDAIIREFSGQELLLDFEGSDVPGVKVFYEHFGANNQPFYRIKFNDLPWTVRLFKK
jgi:hypothetical protein